MQNPELLAERRRRRSRQNTLLMHRRVLAAMSFGLGRNRGRWIAGRTSRRLILHRHWRRRFWHVASGLKERDCRYIMLHRVLSLPECSMQLLFGHFLLEALEIRADVLLDQRPMRHPIVLVLVLIIVPLRVHLLEEIMAELERIVLWRFILLGYLDFLVSEFHFLERIATVFVVELRTLYVFQGDAILLSGDLFGPQSPLIQFFEQLGVFYLF